MPIIRIHSSDDSKMGRIEACPYMEEEGLSSSQAIKDDSRQSDSDTEQQQQQEQHTTGDVEELRTQLRERDGELVTLKDDKAVYMRQILELKDQLYQLVSLRNIDVVYIIDSLRL